MERGAQRMSNLTKYQKFTAVTIQRSEIKNAPYNPRQIKQTNLARLREGVKKHGLVGAITWNATTGHVVGGHRRLEVLDALEAKNGNDDYALTVDKIEVPLAEEKAINLLLNNKKAQGEDNLIQLQSLFEEMQEEGIPFEDAGYTFADIQNIFPDTFLPPEIEEQNEANADTIDTLSDFKEAGKEQDAEFRAQMQSFQQENPDASYGLSDNEEAAPQAEPASVAPPPDPEHPDWKHDKDYFHEHRGRTVENNRDFENETDVILSLYFQNNAQLQAFQRAFNLPDQRSYDIFEIKEFFGVDI